MDNVKIYELKLQVADVADDILKKDDKYFYWSNNKFTKNKFNDLVFILNPEKKWALYTRIIDINIPRTNYIDDHSYFGILDYSMGDSDNTYLTFIKFEILQKNVIPKDWRFSVISAHSSTPSPPLPK